MAGKKLSHPLNVALLELLRRKIAEKGQSRLAAELGVQQGFLSEIKAGKRNAGPKVLEGLMRIDPEGLLEILGANTLEAWRSKAIEDGEDPDDPDVSEIYSAAFEGALGAAHGIARANLIRRRAAKGEQSGEVPAGVGRAKLI